MLPIVTVGHMHEGWPLYMSSGSVLTVTDLLSLAAEQSQPQSIGVKHSKNTVCKTD